MKNLLKKIVLRILAIDAVGRFIKWFSTFVWKIKYQRQLLERKEQDREVFAFAEKTFSNKTVLNGPFKGLVYPEMRAKSSALYSKFLGSYEQELHSVFERVIQSDYEQILDIGCAEGYYAVGLALKMPTIEVFAYDIDAEARALTEKMARANEVADRVQVRKECSEKTLSGFDFSKKTLILSDCEGYERFLFTAGSYPNLKNVDMIIETHDWVDIHISSNLESLFEGSHQIEVIPSLSDVQKAKSYQYPELEGLSLQMRYYLLEEGRRFVDEWLVMTAKEG